MVSPIVDFIDMSAIKLSYVYEGGPHAQSENWCVVTGFFGIYVFVGEIEIHV